jgi:hypothetical protein
LDLPYNVFVKGLMFEREGTPRYYREAAKHFDRMYARVGLLSGTSTSLGTLGIAKVVVYWKEYFKDDPLYDNIMSLLLWRGIQEEGWFPVPKNSHDGNPNTVGTLEDEFSGLRIDCSAKASAPTMTIDERELLGISTDQISELATTVLSHAYGGGAHADQRETRDSVVCEFITKVKKQNEKISHYLHHTSTASVARSIKVQAFAVQCEYFVKAIETEQYWKESKDNIDRDFNHLIACLKGLKATL